MKLAWQFRDPDLLQRALTHRSWAAENQGGYYENLEYLGDAVLQLLVSDLLYRRFPGWDQGQLSKARQKIVCRPTLAALSAELEIGPAVRLGRGELLDRKHGGDKPRILADVFEAMLGALYLDGGLEAVAGEVGVLLDARVRALSAEALLDAKSRLQELVQQGHVLPEYTVEGRSGPDNAPRFEVYVTVDGTRYGPGCGTTQREAEQGAATVALARLAARP